MFFAHKCFHNLRLRMRPVAKTKHNGLSFKTGAVKVMLNNSVKVCRNLQSEKLTVKMNS